ncbi:MipA/OmpV family protein, partial [Lysobacter sp. TAB13]|uniref:MipA/OmpV family protein n=1 Tax=Lysobacter sp. TAB13 TaxID=3233065 RepID=UPI003F9623A9
EFWPIEDRLRTRIEVRQGFHGHHGIVADIFVDWVQPIGRFKLSGGPRFSFGNQAYMRRNFGVTPEESAANGLLAAYSPSGGVKSAGLAAALEYAWSDVWKRRLTPVMIVFCRMPRARRSSAPLARATSSR